MGGAESRKRQELILYLRCDLQHTCSLCPRPRTRGKPYQAASNWLDVKKATYKRHVSP